MTKLNHFTLLMALALMAGCGDDAPPRPDAGPDASAARCGDGVVSAGEPCDDGNNIGGDGCEVDCSFSCAADADCADGDTCNGAETCNTALHRCQAALPLADGSACMYLGTTEVGDGGVGEPVLLPGGRCVDARCGAPCTITEDPSGCDDGNACNGVETCEPTHSVCVPGPALVCDDDLACTVDSCDPALACQVTLLDADADGFADEGVACGEVGGVDRSGDCDDSDNTVYPGAAELCGDGKDNDCDGSVDESEPLWYLDCDGDDYATTLMPTMTQCTEPAPQGSCGWTTRRPTNIFTTDCDDGSVMVHPGAKNPAAGSGGYFSLPYCFGANAQAMRILGVPMTYSCAGSGGTPSWDYDCNAQDEQETLGVDGVCTERQVGRDTLCDGAVWLGTTAPACGQQGLLSSCGYNEKRICVRTSITGHKGFQSCR